MSDLIVNVALELLYIHEEGIRRQEMGSPGRLAIKQASQAGKP